MSISLILIALISLVVIAGTAYLYLASNDQLTQDKKNKILLIVGTVIFISFLVTTLKHRKIGLASRDSEDGAVNIKKVFFGNGCHFRQQSNNQHALQISDELLSQIYAKNYQSLYDKPAKTQELKQLTADYQEIIVYLSDKDEGASYFLNHLATKRCRDMRMPVVYLDLHRDYRTQNQFLQEIGVNSFEQLQKYMCHFSAMQKQQTKSGTEYLRNSRAENSGPYLIIDNFQKLLNALAPADEANRAQRDGQLEQVGQQVLSKRKGNSKLRVFGRILDELVGRCRMNIIVNTEKHWAVQQLYQLWQQISEQQNPKYKNRLQLHRWQGLNQYNLYKILSKHYPNHDATINALIQPNQQHTYSFQQLFAYARDLKNIVQTKHNQVSTTTTRDELQLKEWNVKYNVAKYFGLEKTYRALKTAQDKRVSILKNKLAFSEVNELQQLGLVQIVQGVVVMK